MIVLYDDEDDDVGNVGNDEDKDEDEDEDEDEDTGVGVIRLLVGICSCCFKYSIPSLTTNRLSISAINFTFLIFECPCML
jgi:hypothetical protein